jgi:aminopeptidase N
VLKAYFLRIDEQPLDRRYFTWYQELVVAREKLMSAVNRRYRSGLISQFEKVDTYTLPAGHPPAYGIEDRLLKNVLLEVIAIDDSAESHGIILDHYRKASTASDRVAALAALNRSSCAERRTVLERVYKAWHEHLSGYANYLRIVAGGTQEDVFAMIEREKERPTFDITQPTWCRALFLPMAANNQMVWTDRGIQWVAGSVIELAVVNPTTASRLLNTFQHVRSLKPNLRDRVKPALEKIVRETPENVSPTIHRQASAYLGGVQSSPVDVDLQAAEE